MLPLLHGRESMRTIRIHVTQLLTSGSELSLPAQASEHVGRVLRMTPGDTLTLFNGDGFDYAATIMAADKRDVVVRVMSKQAVHNESPLALTLAQAVVRGDKMDLIVQKATELGISRVVPLLTERSEVKLDGSRAEKRLARWRSIAASACEQCGRARLPDVTDAINLTTWLTSLNDHGALRLALLPSATTAIHQLHFSSAGGVLVVGPEGGLGERDIRALTTASFTGLQLGPRILRTETAGLAALAALQAVHGDM